MKKTLLTLLTATLLFSCDETLKNPGEYKEEFFPSHNLPVELKGLKVYQIRVNRYDLIYIAVLPNKNTTINYGERVGKINYSRTVVTIQAPDTLYSNDSITILKNK